MDISVFISDCLGVGLLIFIFYKYRQHIDKVKQEEKMDKNRWHKGL